MVRLKVILVALLASGVLVPVGAGHSGEGSASFSCINVVLAPAGLDSCRVEMRIPTNEALPDAHIWLNRVFTAAQYDSLTITIRDVVSGAVVFSVDEAEFVQREAAQALPNGGINVGLDEVPPGSYEVELELSAIAGRIELQGSYHQE